MQPDIERLKLKEIALRLGLDKPILAARVVGGQLELRLLGGEIVYWPLPAGPDAPADNETPGAADETAPAPGSRRKQRKAPATRRRAG